jgi:FdhE protein
MASPGADTRWAARIARARRLAAERPAVREALEFFADLTALQQSLAARHADPASALPDYLGWLEQHAPGPIAQQAIENRRSTATWQRLLDEYLASASTDTPAMFVVEALLHTFPPNPCPDCSGPPVVSLLREAGHGARRSHVCGLCFTESAAQRLGCFACGEDRVEALSVFRTDATDPARIDACDSCKVYLKTIDLTRDGSACPIGDDLASVSLDLWAREQGYRRLRANLLRL